MFTLSREIAITHTNRSSPHFVRVLALVPKWFRFRFPRTAKLFQRAGGVHRELSRLLWAFMSSQHFRVHPRRTEKSNKNFPLEVLTAFCLLPWEWRQIVSGMPDAMCPAVKTRKLLLCFWFSFRFHRHFHLFPCNATQSSPPLNEIGAEVSFVFVSAVV